MLRLERYINEIINYGGLYEFAYDKITGETVHCGSIDCANCLFGEVPEDLQRFKVMENVTCTEWKCAWLDEKINGGVQ